MSQASLLVDSRWNRCDSVTATARPVTVMDRQITRGCVSPSRGPCDADLPCLLLLRSALLDVNEVVAERDDGVVGKPFTKLTSVYAMRCYTSSMACLIAGGVYGLLRYAHTEPAPSHHRSAGPHPSSSVSGAAWSRHATGPQRTVCWTPSWSTRSTASVRHTAGLSRRPCPLVLTAVFPSPSCWVCVSGAVALNMLYGTYGLRNWLKGRTYIEDETAHVAWTLSQVPPTTHPPAWPVGLA